MGIAGVFLIMMIAVLLAWLNKRQPAIITYALGLILSIVLFIHHITSATGIML